jgi:eukaryotic-like serine/threonine-protein kinase
MSEKYKIVQKIDAGGMAEVYKGLQDSGQGIEKLVAIKRILPQLTKNQKFIEMFLDEARVSMHLNHANIVQVFDLGQSSETYFIVMEFIDGTSLKALIDYFKNQNRTIPVEQAVYLCMQICEGLEYAHSLRNPVDNRPLNIVHRDISPPNILVSRQGQVKLVDFGLAKAANQISKTDQGVVKGKFSYLSPEAALGQDVDRRTDIFAVGIVLWEFLAGKRLFYGETDYQTVELVRRASIPSLSALNPQVTPDLEEVVRNALARDPNARYQTSREFGEELNNFIINNRMRVTPYDIGRLVEDVLSWRAASSGQKEAGRELIHDLIQDELLKFNSLGENESKEQTKPSGAGGPLIDPREWANLIGSSDSSQNLSPVVSAEHSGGLADILEPDGPQVAMPKTPTLIPPSSKSGAIATLPPPPPSQPQQLHQLQSPPTPAPGSNRALLVAAAVLLLLLGGVGVYAYLNGLIGGSSASIVTSTPPRNSP